MGRLKIQYHGLLFTASELEEIVSFYVSSCFDDDDDDDFQYYIN